MSLNTASKLDIEKFRKVHALMIGGATEGERTAAKTSAEKMARRAGVTLEQAISSIEITIHAQQPINPFDEFFNSPEMRAERAEREREDEIKRQAILREYGSVEAVWADTEREMLLSTAVDHMKDWKEWTDNDGSTHSYISGLNGANSFYWLNEIDPDILNAVSNAYPIPSTLGAVLSEYREWDKLYAIRSLFGAGDHWHWSEARITVLRDILNNRPVCNWEDMDARIEWGKIEAGRGFMASEKEQLNHFSRLEADMKILREQQSHTPVQTGHATTSARRNAVLSILDSQPELSDREIARRAGVSPQTAGNLRRRWNSGLTRGDSAR